MTETPQWMKESLAQPLIPAEIMSDPTSISELNKKVENITGCMFNKVLKLREEPDKVNQKLKEMKDVIVSQENTISVLNQKVEDLEKMVLKKDEKYKRTFQRFKTKKNKLKDDVKEYIKKQTEDRDNIHQLLRGIRLIKNHLNLPHTCDDVLIEG